MGQREETTEELSERVLARLRREYSLVSSEVWVDDVRELVVIRSGGYERCVAYIDCEDLFRLPPDYTHADVIDSSYGHIKVLDHRGVYVSVPCTYLDIK